MPLCTRPGCGAEFDSPGPCTYHSGSPIFHEGLKSWSCCNETHKPVLEFDQFLALPTCSAEAQHSNVKRVKPDSSITAKVTADAAPLTAAALASAQTLSKPSSTPSPAEPKPEEEDAVDANVAVGTKCKRSGCEAVFEGGERDKSTEACTYHKGVAVFHEGSKGYTCCKRRVLDFADFLQIQPCTTSTHGHLFVGAASVNATTAETPADGKERVQCRMDHYETPSQVHVTVYAKGVDRETSLIELKETEICLCLSLAASPTGQARVYERTLAPFAPIDVAKSSFSLTKFKLEMILAKAITGQSWPTLEKGQQAFGYGNTFGRT